MSSSDGSAVRDGKFEKTYHETRSIIAAADMFEVGFGDFTVSVQEGSLPDNYSEYASHAQLKLESGLQGSEGRVAFCGVAKGDGWPSCIVAFRYAPAGYGFTPGVLVVPETEILFVGGGTLLLAVNLARCRLLWEDTAEMGFWCWRRHSNIVLMSAELELAAWNAGGRKLWTTFVEPPWSYTVEDGRVALDVMGNVSDFSMHAGPPAT
jgi:hypothetical protein